ncbi:hypothetical protein Goklo_008518 [Gossypium klotzschianum]|uniref:Uncharacterized protein n=1 Tax=Gossypium klotzschianum TaxID=34286 RepID=A0A7J8V000_9ROSI|nr:hypothetical protein [Gossypium klotzschianum]
MSNAWNQTRRIKRLAVVPMTTPEYNEWWVRRINDNISEPSHKNKLEKKIEQMEEKNELDIRHGCSETRERKIKKRES